MIVSRDLVTGQVGIRINSGTLLLTSEQAATLLKRLAVAMSPVEPPQQEKGYGNLKFPAYR